VFTGVVHELVCGARTQAANGCTTPGRRQLLEGGRQVCQQVRAERARHPGRAAGEAHVELMQLSNGANAAVGAGRFCQVGGAFLSVERGDLLLTSTNLAISASDIPGATARASMPFRYSSCRYSAMEADSASVPL
jgi:hypothetical protein